MAFKLVGIHRGQEIPLDVKPHDYRGALRAAVGEILGGGGPDKVRVFMGRRLVAICDLQSRDVGKRGHKFSVVCSGEKPAKRR